MKKEFRTDAVKGYLVSVAVWAFVCPSSVRPLLPLRLLTRSVLSLVDHLLVAIAFSLILQHLR